MTSSELDLGRYLREVAFGSGGTASKDFRVGMEVEFIPVRQDSGAVVPLGGPGGMNEILTTLCSELGWKAGVSAAGAPRFELPGGGAFSFEPGGQIECISRVHDSVDGLCSALDDALAPALAAFGERGIVALARGIDPTNPAESAALFLCNERYDRLARYFETFGLAGRRMMRQTAAIHLNIEFGARPLQQWELANRLAPYLIGIFANSSMYEGQATGFRSYRAQQWRELDPERTGVVLGDDPVEAYLAFAKRAPALFLGDDDVPRRPLSDWMNEGDVEESVWRRHLSTLFPEVRARGYLELRGVDALEPVDHAAPAVFSVGILCDERASGQASDLLPEASLEALAQAGRTGVSDPVFHRVAVDLWEIALAGAKRLGPVVGPRSVASAERFFREYTARGLDPATNAEKHEAAEAV